MEIQPHSNMEQPETRRIMGGFSATMVVVASMVGTGVFTTAGFLLEKTPSAITVLISWVVCGIFAFCGAVSYAELVAMSPRNGGEYQLLSKTFHPAVGFMAGWISLIVGFSAPIASTAIAFGAYASSSLPVINKFWAAVAIIVLLSCVHAFRVSFGAIFQNIFTAAKLILVSVFIGGGLLLGHPEHITGESLSLVGSTCFSPSFAVGLIFVTYAYTGWNGSAYIAGEIKDPTKAVPKALAMGTGLVTLIYLGLNTVFLMAVPLDAITGQLEVGAIAAKAIFGNGIGSLMSGIIALFLVSSLSAMVMSGPRIYQTIGEDYKVFSFLAKRRGASGPYFAILLQAAIALIMLLSAQFDTLVAYMGFTLSINAALTVAGVFVERIRHPEVPRPYKCWGYPVTPALFILSSIWMVGFTIYENPVVALAGGGTILMGFLIYWLVERRNRS